MARILCYTSPARGHLYPVVETLLELQARGHEVHVRSLASEVDALRRLGFRAAPLDPAIEHTPLDTWRATTPEEGLALALSTFARRAEHEVPDFQAALAAVRPDIAIVDITTVGAAAAAEAAAIPWVRTIPLFQHFSLDPTATRELTMVPFGIAPPGIDLINALRRSVGLTAVAETGDEWRANIELYFTARPFEDPSLQFPASFRLVGPGLWEPPGEPPGWLQDVSRPLVVVSVSSEFQRDDALVNVALESMSSEDVDVVVTSAAHDPERFAATPNARVVGWLPHGVLLRQAAVVVCHGGMGITQKALAAGVPVCVVPFGRDQFEVAARVLATNSGTVVYPNELGVEPLRAAIHGAAEMRAGARTIAGGFGAAGGRAAAATAVEYVVRSTRPIPAGVG